MNCYEHTFITKQDLPLNQAKTLVNKYEDIIKKNSGKVIKTEEWGLRNLSHVIKHNKTDGKNTIKTTILINDGWLIITNSKSIINSKEESFGTGLENLKARYKLLSDKKIQVHDMDKKFEVFIPIIGLSALN